MAARQVSLRDVVALLYRADWTGLSLSATLTSWADYELRRRMRGVHPPVSPAGGEHELPVTEHRKYAGGLVAETAARPRLRQTPGMGVRQERTFP